MLATRLRNLQHLRPTLQSVFGVCPAAIYPEPMCSFTCEAAEVCVEAEFLAFDQGTLTLEEKVTRYFEQW